MKIIINKRNNFKYEILTQNFFMNGIKGRRIMPNQVEDVKKILLEFNVEI
mgnify:FL=1